MTAALASPRSTVCLYLPSEYGVNWSKFKYSHPVWNSKRDHIAALRERHPTFDASPN